MRVLTIILGVLVAIGGFFCILYPGATFLSVGWIVAILFLMSGFNMIADYVSARKSGAVSGWDLFLGILTLLLGIIIAFNQFAKMLTDVIMIYVFGVWLVVSGIMRIAASIRAKKLGGGAWVWVLILGILSILLGIYAFFHPMVSAIAIGWLIGFFVLLQGINLITLGASMGGGKGGNAPAA